MRATSLQHLEPCLCTLSPRLFVPIGPRTHREHLDLKKGNGRAKRLSLGRRKECLNDRTAWPLTAGLSVWSLGASDSGSGFRG